MHFHRFFWLCAPRSFKLRVFKLSFYIYFAFISCRQLLLKLHEKLFTPLRNDFRRYFIAIFYSLPCEYSLRVSEKNEVAISREFWLRENGVTQPATCCTMWRKGWVGIGHKRFMNSGSVLGRHPGRGYTEGRVVPCCRRVAIGIPF